MIGIGSIVNAAAIIVCGIIGTIFKGRLPERFQKTMMQAMGLVVLIIGASGTLQGVFTVNQHQTLERNHIMLLILSLVIGTIIGELINIDKGMLRLGDFMKEKFAKNQHSTHFTEGFVSSVLIFCVGAMAIVGAIEDGLKGNPSTLFAKAVMDGVTTIILASKFGRGVIFSALPVFGYQFAITLLAQFVSPYFNPLVIMQLSMVGGILIMAIGLNLLGIRNIKVANMLPALFVPVFYQFIQFS
jgi:uncharacterized membrane protein YqgA involved in biofilm formation